MAKQLGSSTFYSIDTKMLSSTETAEGGVTIAARLKDILRIDLPKKKVVPSEEICKKCFRQLNEIDYLESQVRSKKSLVIA